MSLYTERHGMRVPIEKTYVISIKAYSLLFDCCSRYWDHLAWKYPDECPDGNGCCGIDWVKFNEDMEFEIPTLFRRSGMIDKPAEHKNVFETESTIDDYDQYALFDLIEYIANNVHDITRKNYHSYYRHDDLTFANTNIIAKSFATDINAIFEKTGLLYHLTTDYEVERVEEASVLSAEIQSNIAVVKESGLKELLQTAIQKHKSLYPDDQKDAVEKIWDALERLKTYYTALDKKASATKIVEDMANKDTDYITLFNDEFVALTKIGNNYRIRHHETDKIDIADIRHYDYFFNRCLSLIATAIQFLK